LRPLSRAAAAPYSREVSGFIFTLLILAMGATLVVLFMGLFSMARGGEFAKRNSNRFMRWRVILQGVAVLLFVLFMMLWHRG
jgi:hypothetical protein